MLDAFRRCHPTHEGSSAVLGSAVNWFAFPPFPTLPPGKQNKTKATSTKNPWHSACWHPVRIKRLEHLVSVHSLR